MMRGSDSVGQSQDSYRRKDACNATAATLAKPTAVTLAEPTAATLDRTRAKQLLRPLTWVKHPPVAGPGRVPATLDTGYECRSPVGCERDQGVPHPEDVTSRRLREEDVNFRVACEPCQPNLIASDKKGTTGKISRTFAWTPRSESGRDCLVCAEFARQRPAES